MLEYSYDHLHFKCSDPDVTAKFYVDCFGGKQLFKTLLNGVPVVGVRVGGQTLLLSGKGPDDKIEGDMAGLRYGIDHWGILVNDLDAAYADLKAKGVEFVREPTVLSEKLRIAFVNSPDNVRIEIMQKT
ncbi:MAG: VOC family protein [Dehalococcoidia bacterium]|nr:VOC family protein [Dehalococcoidia bacterium]